MIPQNIVEDIKARSEIEEVVSSYVSLKRAGSNFVGCCPFHSEKTPSFTVFPATQTFHCFGCGAGGDVITFVMRQEALEYPEALELLAKRAGIDVSVSAKDQAGGVSRKRVLDMNKSAAIYFRNMLFDPQYGSAAQKYLTDRGLSQAVIKRFGIGFSPDTFGLLRDHLLREGYTPEEMTAGFLCGISRKNNKLYDYFRGRVMFPIIDTAGNVIAFGGRVMDDSVPKYLNTSDTPAFKKSRNLFALNYARNACAESLILCEGYMDVIALHDAGISNAVATLGTAITPEQARIMAKYTKRVIISYDSDAAGQRAAERAMTLLREVGLDVRILHMTGAKDPDEYIKKYGPERFRQLMGESRNVFEHRLALAEEKYDFALTEDKLRAVSELCTYIATVHSPMEREVYIGRVAEKAQVSPQSVAREVDSVRRRTENENKKRERTELLRQGSGISDRINPDTVRNIRASHAEQVILGLMLTRNEYIRLCDKYELSEEDFFTEFNRRVYAAVKELHAGTSFDVGLLNERFSADEMSRIISYGQSRAGLDNSENVFAESIGTLRNEKSKSSLTENTVDSIQKLLDLKKKQSETQI